MDIVTYVDPKNYHSVLDFDLAEFDLTEGLVAVGGKLDVGTLFQAYYHGIFPWPQEKLPLLWFSPDPRGILFFKDFSFSDRLEKEWRKKSNLYEFTFNKAFEQVINECQTQVRPGQNGTWILPGLKKAYIDFHKAGFAHSVECWREGELVGGLYGVLVQGVFSGESMFHKENNTSKWCLMKTVQRLQELGLSWMDTQMVTPVVGSVGGKEIPRDEYLKLLKEAHRRRPV